MEKDGKEHLKMTSEAVTWIKSTPLWYHRRTKDKNTANRKTQFILVFTEYFRIYKNTETFSPKCTSLLPS